MSPLPENVWNDANRLRKVVTPPQSNKLVIKANTNAERNKETRAHVENAIMEQKSPVQAYDNSNGDLVVLCENENDRDQLKASVASKDNDIAMSTPSPIRDYYYCRPTKGLFKG